MISQGTLQEITAALLAVITVTGAFLLVIYDTVNSKPIDVPMWVTLMIGAIVGSYFTHTASANGARKAGTAAAQTAIEHLDARNTNVPGATTVL